MWGEKGEKGEKGGGGSSENQDRLIEDHEDLILTKLHKIVYIFFSGKLGMLGMSSFESSSLNCPLCFSSLKNIGIKIISQTTNIVKITVIKSRL